MQDIHLNPQGGPVFAEVRSGFANPGSYTLLLWEKNSNNRAMDDVRGNFMNADDDNHQLPGAAAQQDGRIVESLVTVSPLGVPGGGTKRPYFTSLRLTQDKQVLGDISFSGETDQPSITIDLFARFVTA